MFLADSPINPDDILKKLIPNFWSFLVQLLAFLILFVAIFFLVYKPVKKMLKKRNDYVKKNIDESKEKELLSEEKLKKADENLTNSYKEANVIINDAKKEATAVKEEIILKAKEEAKDELLKAKEDIASEIKRSEDEIKKEMVNIAIMTSEKILEREVTMKDDEKRINGFIDDLRKDN